jgi:hypothetical protein
MTKEFLDLFSVPTIDQLRGTLDQRMKKGWAITQPNEVSDERAKERSWLVRRGQFVDTILTSEEEKLEAARKSASRTAAEKQRNARNKGKWKPERE